MELLMIRTETVEVPEATMARFFNGLNIEVQDRVEMAVYYNIEDLVHQAERAEQQIKRRQDSATNTWRRSHMDDPSASSRPASTTRSNNSSQKEAPKSGVSRAASSTQSSANIECFTCGGRGHKKRDCPNAKKILLTQDGYISASDEEELTDTTSEKSEEIEQLDGYELTANCKNLMVKRVQADRIEDKGQRWNIFQTQCQVNNTCCKLIIDSGSYTNVVSKSMVDALALSTWKHPQPHCVEWLYESGKLKVTRKVRLKFSVDNYSDTVICDVLPMDACQLLLGRPWQYDRRSTHDGRSNTYSFWDDGRRHVLRPMLEQDIKVDTTVLQKKSTVKKVTPKPRSVWSQGGEDDVAISTSYIIPARRNGSRYVAAVKNGSNQMEATCKSTHHDNKDHLNNIGNISVELVPAEKVIPTFRTPCTSIMFGSIEVPLQSIPS
jgi:hypothetical protein